MKKLLILFFIVLPYSLYGRDFCEYATKISEYIQDSVRLYSLEKWAVRSKPLTNWAIKNCIKRENECVIDSAVCDFNNCNLALADYFIEYRDIDSLEAANLEACSDSCYDIYLKTCMKDCWDTFTDETSRDSCKKNCDDIFPKDTLFIALMDSCRISCLDQNPFKNYLRKYAEMFFSNIYKISEQHSWCYVICYYFDRRYKLHLLFDIEETGNELKVRCVLRHFYE